METVLTRAMELFQQGNLREAAAVCESSIGGDCTDADILHLAGMIALHEQRWEDAVELLRRSAVLDPLNSWRQQGLGDALCACGRSEEASVAFQQALVLSPEWFLPYHRLASIYYRLQKYDEAIELLRECIVRAPQYGHARMDLGMLLLQLGRDHEGWSEYEWRWKIDGMPLHRSALPVPLWDGSPLQGRTLFVWSEQGFGDGIQFARFLMMVPKDGGRIVLHVPDQLASLIASCPAVDEVLADGEWFHADVQFPMMSLPKLFGVALSDVGGAVPYLFPPSDTRVAEELVPQVAGLVNVGLVWASSRPRLGFIERDCPLPELLTLSGVSGVRLYGLQFGEHAADIAGNPAIHDLSTHLGDFHQTAAFVERMDLVITVDTSMAHLAGALGKPVWTMLSRPTDWRWRNDGTTTSWYPSMRLYRQPERGDWSSVIASVREDLARVVSSTSESAPAPVRRSHRASRPHAQVYLKQYGEMRTGTNIVRSLLLKNYRGATVLMHILGDKHSPPPDFATLRERARSSAEADFEFVRDATFGTPSLTTTERDRRQIHLLTRMASPVANAWDSDSLGFLISIRNPYAWAGSLIRFRGWISRSDLGPLLEQACSDFNTKYTAWLGLVARHRSTHAVIRHEDLIADPVAVLRRLESRFDLPAVDTPVLPPAQVLPAVWDYSPICIGNTPFDAADYRKSLPGLSAEHRSVVTRSIDWKLLEPIGYQPLETPTEREFHYVI